MIKYLLSLTVVFLLAMTCTQAQITTFNYLSSGFSTSSCNLFSPATDVTGSDGNSYLHTSLYGAPVYSGGVELYNYLGTVSCANWRIGTAYAISYPFKPGYNYAFTIAASNVWANGNNLNCNASFGQLPTPTPGATSELALGISNTLPATSSYQACTPTTTYSPPSSSPFSTFYSSNLLNSSTGTTVTVSNVTVASNSQYLLVGSWPGPAVYGANWNQGAITISGLTISATPQILPNVTYICSSQVYSISVSPSATWTVSPASGVLSISPNGNSVTVTKTGSGNAVLTATLPNGVSGSIDITTVPSCNISSSPNGSCSGTYQTWFLQATPNCPNANNWSWTQDIPSSGSFYISSPTSPNTYVDVSGGGGISVSFEDACGVRSTKNGVTIYSECGTGEAAAFSVFPNPASGSTTITSLTPSTTTTAAAIYGVRIVDKTGNTRKTQRFATGLRSAQVSLVGLSPDVYFISVVDGKKWTTQNIVIK